MKIHLSPSSSNPLGSRPLPIGGEGRGEGVFSPVTSIGPYESSSARFGKEIWFRFVRVRMVSPVDRLLWVGYRERSAYLRGETVRNFSVSGHRFNTTSGWTCPEGVGRAFEFQETPMPTPVTKEVISLHPTATVSRVALAGSPRNASSRLSASISQSPLTGSSDIPSWSCPVR